MHGHTKIQLFDADTGKLTDEVEKDNTWTGALEEYLMSYLIVYPSYELTSLYKCLSGVLIFQDNIDTSHKYITRSDILNYLGHAGDLGYKELSNDTSAGILNTVETNLNYSEGIWTLVWDFGTEACNGDIGAICLTHGDTGHYGLFYPRLVNEENLGHNLDGSASRGGCFISDLSDDDSKLYLSGSVYSSSFTVKKYKANEKYRNYNSGVSFSLTNKFVTPSWTTLSDKYCCRLSNNTYLIYNITSSGNTLTIQYYDIDGQSSSSETVDLTDLRADSDYTGSPSSYWNNIFAARDDCFIFIRNGYLWRLNKNGTYSKNNISSHPKYSFFDDRQNVSYYRDILLIGGIYRNSTGNQYAGFNFVVDLDNLTISEKNLRILQTAPGISQRYQVTSFASPFIGNNNEVTILARDYLATINNQDDILTKTPDKTMKIIYTLEEA